jgi:hypothetical protein
MPNFITATLYDNDFAQLLKSGVVYIAERAEDDLSEEDFKEWLVEFVIYFSLFRRISRHNKKIKDREYIGHLRDYLNTNLRVKYSDKKPEYYDENGEFVMYDRALKYGWTA